MIFLLKYSSYCIIINKVFFERNINMKNIYPKAVISEKCRKRISGGHPWIYDNEITEICGTPEDGGMADVFTEKEKYIGTGFYNSNSKIRIRIVTRNANDIKENIPYFFGADFWRRRLRYAYDYRKTVLSPDELTACRLVFGEADFLPGLTVDRFNDLLSVQILCLGMEKLRNMIITELVDILEGDGAHISGVYLRNDVNIRVLEGMEEEKCWFFRKDGVSPVTEITENGIKYLVDVENGQKTGFFLDQKRNRLAAAKTASGKNVLDCCTHTGSFALNAAKKGAAHVTALDVSETALENAKKNAELNGLSDKISFVRADVFDYLREKIASHDKSFDYIILDPPAFTKSRKTVGNAHKGYLELNTLAMRLLPRGGYLATCSCSHFMTRELFLKMLDEAAAAAGVNIRQIEFREQCADHPILLSVPETDYLKFFLLQIV